MSGIRDRLRQTFLRAYKKLATTSVQSRLGYPENTKLLIIHADDLGITRTENAASIEALEKGMVNSGSIMVPGRGVNEILQYAKSHPGIDVGVHLTLTSEWNSYKWGPVLPSVEVKSLVETDGFFFPDKASLVKKSLPSDLKKELRAQVNCLIEAGVDITHLDSHMFIAFSNKILKIVSELGREFRLPVLLTDKLPIYYLIAKNVIMVDKLYYAKPKNYINGLADFYSEVLRSIKPGLNCILVHLAFDNKEMQDITLDQINFGSAWRQADFDFFTGDECRRLIKENNIQLITWREIRDKLLR
jgi:predicted glycoside hydrolase/deacetylase ChbG (UPF0249 family)